MSLRGSSALPSALFSHPGQGPAPSTVDESSRQETGVSGASRMGRKSSYSPRSLRPGEAHRRWPLRVMAGDGDSSRLVPRAPGTCWKLRQH